MHFPARRLQAKPGVIHGQVFENLSAEFARHLFWSISVPFEPVTYEGEEVRPFLQAEGLTWSLARWQDLAGKRLTEVKDAQRVEASFYVHEHSDVELETLELSARKSGGFELFLRGRVDFFASDGSVRPFRLEVEVPVSLEGVRVVPGNLRLGPRTTSAAREVLGQFIDAAGFAEPEWDGVCFLFPPGVVHSA